MMFFQMHKEFGHASATLLIALSYISDDYLTQHPENKKILF
jgi:hypothetical protein